VDCILTSIPDRGFDGIAFFFIFFFFFLVFSGDCGYMFCGNPIKDALEVVLVTPCPQISRGIKPQLADMLPLRIVVRYPYEFVKIGTIKRYPSSGVEEGGGSLVKNLASQSGRIEGARIAVAGEVTKDQGKNLQWNRHLRCP